MRRCWGERKKRNKRKGGEEQEEGERMRFAKNGSEWILADVGKCTTEYGTFSMDVISQPLGGG